MPVELSNELLNFGARIIELGGRIGASAARNIGVQESTSQYVAFLDGDDTWLPKKLENQSLAMRLVASKYSTTNFFLKRGEVIDEFPVESAENVVKNVNRRCHCAVGSTLIIDREIFLQINGFKSELLRFEDWDLMMRLREIDRSHLHLNQPLTLVNRIPNENWNNHQKSLDQIRAGIANYHAFRRHQVRGGIYYEESVGFFRKKENIRAITAMLASIACDSEQLRYLIRVLLKRFRIF